MKGYYLSRADGIFATQKGPYQFDKFCQSLPRKGVGKNKRFFIPQCQVTEQFRIKNIPVEMQIGNDVLEQLVANVDFNTDQQNEDLNKAWKKARIEKTQVDTKLAGQKLDQRKKQLFNDWSQSFFQSFSNHFGKLRNCLVQMHLNEEQINIFNETLDKCLQNMELDLNKLYNQFTEREEEQ